MSTFRNKLTLYTSEEIRDDDVDNNFFLREDVFSIIDDIEDRINDVFEIIAKLKDDLY